LRLRGSSDSSQVGVRLRTREAGTAVVEFAVIVPLLLLIVFGILDFGRALNYLNDSTQLARAGARWAIVNKPFSELQKADGSPCTGSLAQCPFVGDPVKVTVDVDFTWLPFIGENGPLGVASSTITGSAVMRLEQPPTDVSEGCST
jgi:Flp pilus assembly protein TadG